MGREKRGTLGPEVDMKLCCIGVWGGGGGGGGEKKRDFGARKTLRWI